jgi:hypothetical protein
MILVDTALQKREDAGQPIRVGMVGAGFMGRGIALQILGSVPSPAFAKSPRSSRWTPRLPVANTRSRRMRT